MDPIQNQNPNPASTSPDHSFTTSDAITTSAPIFNLPLVAVVAESIPPVATPSPVVLPLPILTTPLPFVPSPIISHSPKSIDARILSLTDKALIDLRGLTWQETDANLKKLILTLNKSLYERLVIDEKVDA